MVKITNDRESCVLRAEAPAGQCWAPGLHELVESYHALPGAGVPRVELASWRAQARQDLESRIDEYRAQGAPAPCATVDCDWCNDTA